MQKEKWILCPVCNNKTRLRIREDTEIKNFPLYCPKCKQENLINVKKLNISVITEPDALTQSLSSQEINLMIIGSFCFVIGKQTAISCI